MPFVSVMTNQKVSAKQETEIKSAVGRILKDVAGKPEEWLMVALSGGHPIFFKGARDTACAMIEIKYLGAFTADQKKKITIELCTLMSATCGVPPEALYVAFSSFDANNWGWNNAMFG